MLALKGGGRVWVVFFAVEVKSEKQCRRQKESRFRREDLGWLAGLRGKEGHGHL